MAEYKYPDPDDRLTVALIDEEYDGKEWEKSEQQILKKAAGAISGLGENPRERRLFDVGCGIGRLFRFFAGLTGEIIALEPDRDRYEKALAEGARVQEETGVVIQVRNEMLKEEQTEGEQQFDVVLSSHVLQHVARRQAEQMMKTMTRQLRQGGLLLLMTTYTEEKEEFFLESWNQGKRQCSPVSADVFDQLCSQGKGLPVRKFLREKLVRMADSCGLQEIYFQGYHYKTEGAAEGDTEKTGRIKDGGKPRDAFYIFVKR